MVAPNKTLPDSRASAQSPRPAAHPLALARWLGVVALLVVLIVVVGGITRLTESGLSITEWKPVTGILPPLTQEQWEAEFAAYRQIGEYQQIAGPAGMTMADYQFIYFWEWFHRLLGRVIGLAFALPLVWFWIRGAIPAGYKPRLIALLALGGLQGVFGWYMVRSGLNAEMTSVSHLWLSVHLLTALFTLAGLVWTMLDLRALAADPGARPARLRGLGVLAGAVLFVQLLLGAWVAGLSAGLASDSWPLMHGQWLPHVNWGRGVGHILTHDPFWLHFAHRWWAFAAAAALIVLAVRVRPLSREASVGLHVALGVQILLGIATVLSGVEMWLAVVHQAMGAALVVATAFAAHRHGGTAAGRAVQAAVSGREDRGAGKAAPAR